MDEATLKAYQDLPVPESCRLIAFEKAEVVTLESDPPQYLLTVSGTKTWLHMTVELLPRVYIRRPEYWGIEVVGCLRGFGPPALAPFQVSLNITGLLGTLGVEVIGAERSQKIEVPEADHVGRYELQVMKPDGELLRSCTLTCEPAGGSHPNPEEACAQLAAAKGDIAGIPPRNTVCPRIFDPVVLMAEGIWRGEERSFKQEFGNICEGIAGTGGVVFDFE